MKYLKILLLFLFGVQSIYGQEIHEMELERTVKKMNFRANPNTENYDVKHHKLEFTVDPTESNLDGKVTTTFTANQDMTAVTFDLADNLYVSTVKQNGASIYFSHTNKELTITLKNKLTQGESTSVEITYNGNPTNNPESSYEIKDRRKGKDVIWTLSEPYGAKYWWPCKESLTDKIDKIDIYITAPKKYIAVANGLEQSAIVSSGLKTTHFKHQHPIPAYLVAIAVSEYEVYSHTVNNNGNPFEITNYVYPNDLSYAQSKTPVTVDIMNLFSDLFGEYPYANEKYGHAQCGINGGMEHTTVSFMQNFNRDLIAHELAHQWFGNYVTCGSWKDIWLNEGFASYLEGITIEHLDSEESFTDWRHNFVTSITSQQGGNLYLKDSDTTSVNRIFSSRITYKKGAMVIHMLRKKLGNNNFFKGIKSYLTDNKLAYSFAKTSDLKSHLETVSGKNLTAFFNDWVYNEGYPSYNVEWASKNNSTFIKLNQKQSHSSVSFFEADVPLLLKGANGKTKDVVLEHTENNQLFTENIGFQVESIEFDPDYNLISRNNSVTLSPKLTPKDDDTDPNTPTNPNTSIYPNPMGDFVSINTIKGEKINKVIVYDILGRKLHTYKTTKINVSNYAQGTYIFEIHSDKRRTSKSVIKK